ncbi:glycosyltransferase family 4 protein [Fusobacterium sp. SB021]|uniref:glycosyltransferase family 4 protein n=1 Tax=Fusobacterium sp. SB021 TaxID=2744227 RepID=UPI003CEC20BA
MIRTKKSFIFNRNSKRVSKKEKNFLFYVVGDGELKEEFIKKIYENKLENYFFLRGWSEKVEEDIRNFDIALMISKWEGFGLVVCEYMASLKPVIAVNVGGVKNIIENNINGIMINEYSSEKFADKILEIKNDNLLKERLIEKAYKYVKARYSIENEVKKIEVEEVL